MPDTMILKNLPLTIKSAGARQFEFVISSGAVDRDRDVIDPKRWRLEQFKSNPVVLWQHRRDLPPIARAVDIRVSGSRLLATVEFPPKGVSALADEIHDLLEAGFLHSASVGFLAIRSNYNHERDGLDILEAELLEFSIVNIPANAEARVLRCVGESCNLPAMKSWLNGTTTKRCSCGAGDFLELRSDSGLYLALDEPGDRLELIDDIVFSGDKRAINRAIGEVFTRELAEFITRETADSLQEALDYARGRVR